MPAEAVSAFQLLKAEIADAALVTIDPNIPLVVETDASDYAIGATLNQNGKPVAFFSRTLSSSEAKHHSVEKEAYAIVEAVENWRHFLLGKHFKLITDQKSVAFMFDSTNHGKIKNDKIARWRVQLSNFKFDIIYRPGASNSAPDALSRPPPPFCASIFSSVEIEYDNLCASTDSSGNTLQETHDQLCHPGIVRMNHFVKSKNLPFSLDDSKKLVNSCEVCCKIKPRFVKASGTLIKATAPMQQLNIDFKGPLPSSAGSQNKYILTIVDEYSRFPFAFPCRDMLSSTVVKCLNQLFCIFGMPEFIHNDRAPDFISKEVRDYLTSRGIATSKTSRYNPQGNGQCERYNGIIWKTVTLALESKNLPMSAWESVLPDALHSIRSLLCTATNCTPHERMFSYPRKSTSGSSVPSWLYTAEHVYVKKHVRANKYEPAVEKVELLDVNPQYAFVKLPSGVETTVSLREVAPCGKPTTTLTPDAPSISETPDTATFDGPVADSDKGPIPVPINAPKALEAFTVTPPIPSSEGHALPRRSSRQTKQTNFYSQ